MTMGLSDGLLLANPAYGDLEGFEFMSGRVVYLVEHSEEGAVGVALNKSYSASFTELVSLAPALKSINMDALLTDKVLCGGRVHEDIAWLLGAKEVGMPGSFSNESCTLTFGVESLPENPKGRPVICGLGSFGWGAGQLEEELANCVWHYLPATEAVFRNIPFSSEHRGAAQILGAIKGYE